MAKLSEMITTAWAWMEENHPDDVSGKMKKRLETSHDTDSFLEDPG